MVGSVSYPDIWGVEGLVLLLNPALLLAGSLKTSVPGADREHPETTVYQDVVTGLDSVGQSAFNVIPQSLKDSINPNRPRESRQSLVIANRAI